ncbi:hypothetical protein J6590_024642 [Homalodisca vitripennis]|nr:hypothetical protein J6590_024642 [Homalodisca vitripennis]
MLFKWPPNYWPFLASDRGSTGPRSRNVGTVRGVIDGEIAQATNHTTQGNWKDDAMLRCQRCHLDDRAVTITSACRNRPLSLTVHFLQAICTNSSGLVKVVQLLPPRLFPAASLTVPKHN